MKRLIVLLIVIAGGLAAAAFSIPSNAATVNGVSISRQDLNSDLAAIANSKPYQCFLNGEEAVGTSGQTTLPSIDGTGQIVGGGSHPTVTTAFAANYLDTAIGHQLVLELAAKKHIHVTASELQSARTALKGQITAVLQEVSGSKFACTPAPTEQEVLASVPSSFVNENLRFDATVMTLEELMAGVGPTTADRQRYYEAHSAEFDTACFTVAEYSSEADAQAAVASVSAGTPFAVVAGQTTGGGPQGCDILYGVASSLPAGTDLETLPLNTVSNPIAENGVYLVLEITKRTPTSFAQSQSEVAHAAQAAGAGKAQAAIDAAAKTAAVAVDPRYGQWKGAKAQLLPPTRPAPSDVLNSAVNGVTTGSSSSTAPSTGQTP